MITEKTTIAELQEQWLPRELFRYLVFNHAGDGAGNFAPKDKTLLDIQAKNPTWAAQDMAYGLNTLCENSKSYEHLQFSVYSEQEIAQSSDKADVKLIWFPAKKSGSKAARCVLLAAGGAYGAVCSLAEAYPVAAKLSDQGIEAFCLNYRVADGKPLFPRPMEDMGAAVAYLHSHAQALGIDMTHYAVGGFSAGGHLAACWGTESLGYRKYGLPKPELLILAYPLVNVWRTVTQMPTVVRDLMLQGYFGNRPCAEICHIYNVDENIDDKYPATFLIQAQDDTTVPTWNSRELAQHLQKLEVRVHAEYPATGGHGFGLGSTCAADGWVDQAISFWEQLPVMCTEEREPK